MHEKEDVEISVRQDVVLVVFTASSISAAEDIERISGKISDFISGSFPKKIVVDFHDVKFFSSQMLGLLLDIWRRLQDYGGQVVISGINPSLYRVFKITNLDKIFRFYPDTDSAIKAVCAVKREA